MKKKKLNAPFNPDWVSKPGSTISDCLKARQISIEKFAEFLYGDSSPDSVKKAQGLIDAKELITDDVADKLGKFFGINTQFWINREKHFRDGLAAGKKIID